MGEFLVIVAFALWVSFGVAGFKYTFYGDPDEKMPPLLYLVAAAFGPLFVFFAVVKWLTSAKV